MGAGEARLSPLYYVDAVARFVTSGMTITNLQG